jgi:hypothetical protein
LEEGSGSISVSMSLTGLSSGATGSNVTQSKVKLLFTTKTPLSCHPKCLGAATVGREYLKVDKKN